MCNRQALSLNISKKKKRVSSIERRKTLIRDVDLKKKEHLFSKKNWIREIQSDQGRPRYTRCPM